MEITAAHIEMLALNGISMEQFAKYLAECELFEVYKNNSNFSPVELLWHVSAHIEMM